LEISLFGSTIKEAFQGNPLPVNRRFRRCKYRRSIAYSPTSVEW